MNQMYAPVTKHAIIIIHDEVNVTITGMLREDLATLKPYLTYTIPNFQFMNKQRGGSRWNGRISLISDMGHTYLELIGDLAPVIERLGYQIHWRDDRPDIQALIPLIKIPEVDSYAHCFIDDAQTIPIHLRDYQLKGVHAALAHGNGILEMATGSGKTITTAVIADTYRGFGDVIMIVPSIDLALQSQATFQRMGIDTGIWYGEMKQRKTVTISTWQSLVDAPELFDECIALIVDEAHKAKGKELMKILSGPAASVPFRFGVTGTLPEEQLFRKQILAVLGPVRYSLRTAELQDRDVLADANITQVIMKDSEHPLSDEYNETEDWTEALHWLFNQEDRIKFIAKLIKMAAEEIGTVLVLVPYKDHGKILEHYLKPHFGPDKLSRMDGDIKGKKRSDTYVRFNEVDNGVLICTSAIASTGIDIPRLKALVMLESGKKFETILQTLGRGVRKAKDKSSVEIFDIASDMGISFTHARKRLRLYKNAEQPFTIEEVSYVFSDCG